MRNYRRILATAIVRLALSHGAPGAIIHFIEGDGTVPVGGIPIPTNFAGVSVDLETGASSTALGALTNGDANFYFGGANLSNDADAGLPAIEDPHWQPVRSGTNQTDTVLNLTVGTTVGPGSTYASGGTKFGSSDDHITPSNEFTDNVEGYIGFSLIPNAGGSPMYGWMRVTLRDDNGNVGAIHEWAFDNMNNSWNAPTCPLY